MKSKWWQWAPIICITACGYRPMVNNGRTDVSAEIALVENQTPYREISETLTLQLRSQLHQLGISVRKKSHEGSCQLEVRVFSISALTTAIDVRNRQEHAENHQWRIDGMVSIKAGDDRPLWGPGIVTATHYSDASVSAVADVAQSAHTRNSLVDNFARNIALQILETCDGTPP